MKQDVVGRALEQTLDEELETETFGPVDDYRPTAKKADADKVRMDLLPPEFLLGTAHVLTFGAAKYGARNWELGLDWSRVFAALERHLWAWWGGEHTDAETGMSHLWHAACCMSFLVAYEERRTGRDDRPIKRPKIVSECAGLARFEPVSQSSRKRKKEEA